MVKLTEGMVLAKARASDLENVKKLNCCNSKSGWTSPLTWVCCTQTPQNVIPDHQKQKGGGLTDVSIFQQMPNIEVISLSVNSITTLEDFSFCSNLTELYVRRNCIACLSEVWFLRNLPKLRVLWLSDNPCAAGENYRATVLRILPNLHKLDNIVVTFDEVNRALEEGDELEPPINSSGIYSNGHIPNNNKDNKENRDSSMEFMTLDETNKIREQLGLKPLSSDKLSPAKHKTISSHKTKNASILSAVLTLIKELDRDSLEVVANACKDRLESL